jgi:S-adenosylmethionine hydrolase
MWRIAPDARILDLTHSVRKYAIRDGAFLLSRMVGYLEVGVHVAVIDPGVGTSRRPIAIQAARGDRLVGPDNGLLIPAVRALGGVVAARELTATELFLPRVSSTFHGRDIFSPVAAHLANGLPIEQVGRPLEAADLVDLRFPEPVGRDGALETSVLFIDSYGNCRLAGQPEDLERAVGFPLRPGAPFRVSSGSTSRPAERVEWHPTFGDVAPSQPLLYEDADYGGLGIAVNQASAADRFGLEIDTPLRIQAIRE